MIPSGAEVLPGGAADCGASRGAPLRPRLPAEPHRADWDTVPLLFIFDMDDVLVDYDWRARMAGLAAATGLPVPVLRERWWLAEGGELAAEAGAFADADEYFAAFLAATGVSIAEDEWVRVRAAAMRPRPGMLAAAERAAELGTITLLTNNGPLAGRHLPRLAPEVAGLFGEHAYTSSDYGARKPDPVVFERVLARYGASAGEAFFADDLAPNIAGARGVGITSHHVLGDDPASLLAAIESFAASRAL